MSANMGERVGLTGSEKWVSRYPFVKVLGIVHEASMLAKFMFIFILFNCTIKNLCPFVMRNSILITMWKGFGFTKDATNLF